MASAQQSAPSHLLLVIPVKTHGSQIIAFGAFVVGPEMAKAIVDAFLGAEFKGLVDDEFNKRFDKITAIEDEELGRVQN